MCSQTGLGPNVQVMFAISVNIIFCNKYSLSICIALSCFNTVLSYFCHCNAAFAPHNFFFFLPFCKFEFSNWNNLYKSLFCIFSLNKCVIIVNEGQRSRMLQKESNFSTTSFLLLPCLFFSTTFPLLWKCFFTFNRVFLGLLMLLNTECNANIQHHSIIFL